MPQNPALHPKYTRRIAGNSSVAISAFVVSIESERFYRGWRYYWMVCAAWNPEELVSWGHAPTRELAQMAAENAVTKLESGLTQGWRLSSASKSSIGRK